MYEIAEWLNPDERHCHHLQAILFEETTAVQEVKIVRLARYGLSLLLNDRIQSTERDEVIYHEGFVLPAYVAAERFEALLCIGGANGGLVREIVNCPSVSRIEMLDIDRRAFEMCRMHLPHMFRGVNFDQRIGLKFGDIGRLLHEVSGTFDVIFNDVADSIANTAATGFYTKQHFLALKGRLRNHGLLVTQAGPVEHIGGHFLAGVRSTLAELFSYVVPYLLDVPSYGMPWGVMIASDAPIEWDAARLAAKFDLLTKPSVSYDWESHLRMSNLPLLVRRRLQTPSPTITIERPMLTFASERRP